MKIVFFLILILVFHPFVFGIENESNITITGNVPLTLEFSKLVIQNSTIEIIDKKNYVIRISLKAHQNSRMVGHLIEAKLNDQINFFATTDSNSEASFDFSDVPPAEYYISFYDLHYPKPFVVKKDYYLNTKKQTLFTSIITFFFNKLKPT